MLRISIVVIHSYSDFLCRVALPTKLLSMFQMIDRIGFCYTSAVIVARLKTTIRRRLISIDDLVVIALSATYELASAASTPEWIELV